MKKEEQRFADAMKRSEFRAYGPKCSCNESCTCGCMEGKMCSCHLYTKGCPKAPNTMQQRQHQFRTRPDMQSARLVSASSSYGKDRDASDQSQEEIQYGDITTSLEQDNYPSSAGMVARGDKRLPQESNAKPLNVHRQPGKSVYGVEPAGGGYGRTYLGSVPGGDMSCSTGPTLYPTNIPQSYSTIPKGGISPACRACKF